MATKQQGTSTGEFSDMMDCRSLLERKPILMRLFGRDAMSLVGAQMDLTRRTGHQSGVLKQACSVLYCKLHYAVTSRRKACSIRDDVEVAMARAFRQSFRRQHTACKQR